MCSAAARSTDRPVATEPVKVSDPMPGWAARAAPASVPSPVTTLTVPGGWSRPSTRSAKRRAVSGVCSAGLTTAVFPAASAGATLRHSIDSGAFHGTMCAVTPTGSRTV